MAVRVWGATPEEWDDFVALGLTEYLLPVVSDPNAIISARSSMKALGKTPSMFNGEGEVVGLSGWTDRVTTPQQIAEWRAQSALGICAQTKWLRPLDVDIKDPELSARVRQFIQSRYTFPIRFRADSSKFLMCFYMEGVHPRAVIKLSDVKGGPIIEFLANGQQFVACGTHPDGARYEWDWQGLESPPVLTVEQFEKLWVELVAEFGVEVLGGTSTMRHAKVAGAIVTQDAVAKWIMEQPFFLGSRQDKLFIECPWSDHHSSDNGPTQTAYMLPGGRGYERGHFKCMHQSHCSGRTDNEFYEALGYHDVHFEALPDEGDEKSALVLEAPKFRRSKQQKWGVAMVISELENLIMALERPDFCGYHLRYDEFFGEMMMASIDNPSGWERVDDAGKVHLRLALEARGFEQVGREMIRDALIEHARTHRFDSAIEWLTKEVPQWDGVPRIEAFLSDVAKVEDSDYTKAVSRYLWSALAGRVLTPGVKADMVPILVGAQGAGKSMLVEALAPSPEFYVSLSLHERDDNLARLMKAHLVAELAELSGLRSREIEAIKKFITLSHDSWIPKYQEAQTFYKRRLVFIGTTNSDDFLDDATGNRRWLPVEVGAMSMEELAAFETMKEQYWAEAREFYKDHGIDWSAQWLAGDAHEKFSASDTWEEAVIRWLDTPVDLDDETRTPRSRGVISREEVFRDALGLDVKNCKRADDMRLSAIFRALRFTKVKRTVEGERQRGWLTV